MSRRRLTDFESTEARRVFGDSLDYTRAWVQENTGWPNWAATLGASLHGQKRMADNAVTLGPVSYFPVRLRCTESLTDMAWLIHELTHQWQYQQFGWRYLGQALAVQLRAGRRAYDYTAGAASPEAALLQAQVAGKHLADFNREQQGDLARDFYVRLQQGSSVQAWLPFIAEFSSSPATASTP